MNGKRRYLLDTNALVSLGEGDAFLVSLLEQAEYVATSVICKIEYLTGIADDVVSRALFERMLRGIEVVDLRNTDADLLATVVALRAQRPGVKLPDAIVMASAKVTNSVLLTRDKQVLNAKLCETKKF